jgi:alkylation response protein AidB-like acyl-CoA dehydrogenase
MLSELEPSLIELGQLAGGNLYQMQLADRPNEPTLIQWDAWGHRIDKVEVTPLWLEAERIAVEYGLVATAYEQRHGSLSRVHQCALAYLFTPSTDIYSCPLAMTDGAARTLLSSGNQALIDRAVPHLLSRNPEDFWTAGQWMTEITGGSDVGLSETRAIRTASGPESQAEQPDCGGASERPDKSSGDGDLQSQKSRDQSRSDSSETWHLYGNKWFASAITSNIALTLARPEGNSPGGRGLALFYVELRNAAGQLRNIQINRLKDKLGTRKVPTAELTLAGTPAQLVKGTTEGVRNIAPLLNITRLWNGISAVALMRRGLALAMDYARKRVAFGAPLAEKPLHMDTLAGLEAEAEAAFHLAFYVAELTGRAETQSALDQELETVLLRLLTPVMKLTTGKQAVLVLSEIIEAFGGAGYVEDTGLPQLLRDAQVLPIWEGTTNVLSLDTLRALDLRSRMPSPATSGHREASVDKLMSASQARVAQSQVTISQKGISQVGVSQGEEGGHPPAESADSSIAFQAFKSAVLNCLTEAHNPHLTEPARMARATLDHAERWLSNARNPTDLELGARRFAMTLGRTMELALLIKHAQWSHDHEADGRATAAARRFANSGIDLLVDHTFEDIRALLL